MTWILPESSDDRSLWQDLRTQQAGFWVRLALSLVLVLALLSAAMVVLGALEVVKGPDVRTYTNRQGQTVTYTQSAVRDHHVALALATAAVFWFIGLIRIWTTYRRFRTALRTVFGVLAVWAVVIPAAVVVDQAVSRPSDFWIAACIFAGFGGSALWITLNVYHNQKLRASPWSSDGQIILDCPDCGYSMIGLTEARCPECGRQYTLDELVRAQAFISAVAKSSAPPQPPPAVPFIQSQTRDVDAR